MSDFIFPVFVSCVAVVALCLALRWASKPRSLTIIVRDSDGGMISRAVNPSPMNGNHILEIETLKSVNHEGLWSRASEGPHFFWEKRDACRRYLCSRNTFTLEISGLESGTPALIGVYLPEWNLTGTYRAYLKLPRAVSLREGMPYRISMQLSQKDVRASAFKIGSGTLFVRPL